MLQVREKVWHRELSCECKRKVFLFVYYTSVVYLMGRNGREGKLSLADHFDLLPWDYSYS
jgi:hypothetical protein